MTIKAQLDQDLKTAMLAGDKTLVTTLRGLKSAILYAEVASGERETGIDDTTIIDLFMKEAKKRQESADLFTQGGNVEKATAELAEKAIIGQYLPAQLSDEELNKIVTECMGSNPVSMADMGRIIGAVKGKVGASVDGSRIAQAVKTRISTP